MTIADNVAYTQQYNYQTGIDAMDFVSNLEGGWDCIIWDYPYYNSSGKSKWVNKEGGDYNLSTMVSNLNIDELKNLIVSKSDNPIFVNFHTDIRELNQDNKILIWNKTDRNHNEFRGNAEFIEFTTNKPLYWKTRIFNAPANIGRHCAKPKELYKFLFEIIGCEYILDPFAGYGNSIMAAMELGIKIDACDLDDTLQWDFDRITTLEDWF